MCVEEKIPAKGQNDQNLGKAPIHCFTHPAMATLFQIFISHEDREYCRQAAHRAFQCLEGLEQDLSRFRENSDVSRIVQAAVGERLILGEAAVECLQIANSAYLETGGAFDITLGSGMESILFDPENMAVEILAPGVRVDLGAIGKGYAVDRLARELLDWELPRFLIHGGRSSALAADPPQGQTGWELQLTWPATPESELVRLEAQHLAVSGSGLEKGDHIIDPHSGNPVKGKRSVWVWADSKPSSDHGSESGLEKKRLPIHAAIMDALSTAFMVMDREEIGAFIQRHSHIQAIAAYQQSSKKEPIVYRFGFQG